jgi:hypothetical protein
MPHYFYELRASAAATLRAYLFVVDTKFLAEAPRRLVVAASGGDHTRIACASKHSVGTVSTILAVSVGAYRKRADNGRPPCNGSFGFVVAVFDSRCPSTGGRWSAGKVSLFGPKGVVTERGLDGFLPSVLDFITVEVKVSTLSL